MHRKLAFLSLLAVALPGAAQTSGLWTRVDNKTNESIEIMDTDTLATVGNLYIAPGGEGVPPPTRFGGLPKLARRGDKAVLKPGSHWFYFDTTGGAFAMNFKARGTEFNVKFGKTFLDVKSPYVSALGSMNDRGWAIDAKGFLNQAGPAWLTFQ